MCNVQVWRFKTNTGILTCHPSTTPAPFLTIAYGNFIFGRRNASNCVEPFSASGVRKSIKHYRKRGGACLRCRLTRRGRTSRRNPWVFGGPDSHWSSALLIPAFSLPFAPPNFTVELHSKWNAPLPHSLAVRENSNDKYQMTNQSQITKL